MSKAHLSQRTATGYHEAGHAVVCHRLGFQVNRVTIVPSATFAGQCSHENILRRINPEFDNTDRGRMRMQKTIMVCLAGQIAQCMGRARSVRSYHSHADFKLASDLSLRVNGTGPTATAYLEWLTLRTREIIKSSCPVVEALATDLLQQGTITVKKTTIDQTPIRERLQFFWR